MRPLLPLAGIGLMAGVVCLCCWSRPQRVAQPLVAGISTIPLRSGLAAEDRVTVQIDDTDISKCIAMYAELTGRELWPGKKSALQRFDETHGYRLSRWGWVKPFFAPSAGIVYHRDGRFSVSEVKEHLETVLKSAGFVPIPEGKDYFLLLRREALRVNPPS